MNLLDRAKAFVAAKATRIALTVVPLAALTVIGTPVKAGTVAVTFTADPCTVPFGIGSCTANLRSPVGGDTNANWIQLFTVSSVSDVISPPDTEIELSEVGTAVGSFATSQVIPVAWDFTINNLGSSGSFQWDVLFEVLSSACPSGSCSVDPSGTPALSGVGSTEIKGNTTLSVNAGTVTGFQIVLTVKDSDDDSFTVNVPGAGTLDLNTTANSTPEPSSVFLAATGVAGLLWRRKKKQA